MPKPLCVLTTLILLMAAQPVAAFPPTVLDKDRIRLEVPPQITRNGEVISVQVIPRPHDGRPEGSGMLTTEAGLLHLRIVDGEAIRCDGTIVIALEAVATLTPRVGRNQREKSKRPLLIIAEDIEEQQPERQLIDILIGGAGDPLHLTVIGVLQVISPRGV